MIVSVFGPLTYFMNFSLCANGREEQGERGLHPEVCFAFSESPTSVSRRQACPSRPLGGQVLLRDLQRAGPPRQVCLRSQSARGRAVSLKLNDQHRLG